MSSSSVAIITAMVTTALLILGSASLVASALVRMARVVDRARVLASIAHEGSWDKHFMTPDALRSALLRHATRAKCTERSIAFLYGAIVVFVASCVAIAATLTTHLSIGWLPGALATVGTLLLLVGALWMVVDSRLSGQQSDEGIVLALKHLKAPNP